MADPVSVSELGMAIIGGVFTVLWWLLKQKDEKQEAAIKLLFEKHDEDSHRLDELKLEIARQHYVKQELDTKFDRLEISIKSGMHELAEKFDKLATTLLKRNP